MRRRSRSKVSSSLCGPRPHDFLARSPISPSPSRAGLPRQNEGKTQAHALLMTMCVRREDQVDVFVCVRSSVQGLALEKPSQHRWPIVFKKHLGQHMPFSPPFPHTSVYAPPLKTSISYIPVHLFPTATLACARPTPEHQAKQERKDSTPRGGPSSIACVRRRHPSHVVQQ